MKNPTFMGRLKKATSGYHRRLEELPFFAALADGTLPKLALVGQLRALAIQNAVLEPALEAASLPGLADLWKRRTPRLPLLLRDLDGMADLLPDVERAVRASLASTAILRTRSLERPAALVGYLYVMEGTTLGNAVHAGDAARVLGLPAGEVPASYDCYGTRLADNWREFAAGMEGLRLCDARREEAIEAAVELFEGLHEIHGALYPFAEADLGYCATAINPGAGNHPVPQDPAQIRAARRAAARCRAEFPYFGQRYEERGRRFADSDAAWLATLQELSGEVATAQARWLAGVLAARGMPSVTLERQLELLHEELCAALPGQAERFAVLSKVAAALAAERRGLLDPAREERLTERFERGVARAELEQHPDAARLFLSAALDERLGRSGAVTGLEAWLADPARFSPSWRGAARELIEEVARLAGSGRQGTKEPPAGGPEGN